MRARGLVWDELDEVHPAVAQSILRNKKLSTTMEIYTYGVNSAQVAKFLNALGLKATSEAVN